MPILIHFCKVDVEPARLNSIATKVHNMAQASIAPKEITSKRKGRKSG